MHPTALTVVFVRFQQPLRTRVRRIVNTSEANLEDACAHAWLQLVRCGDELQDPLAWLTTVAVREAVKLDRRSRRALPMLESDASEQLEPADPRLAIELRDEVLAAATALATAQLTNRQRRILGLHVAGYSYHEISAQHTGDSVRTVERQLARARSNVRRALGGENRPAGAL